MKTHCRSLFATSLILCYSVSAHAERRFEVSVDYDGHGELVAMAFPEGGAAVANGYTPGGGQESSLVLSSAGPAGISAADYDLGGGVERALYTDGAESAYGFDDLGRLVEESLRRGGSDLYRSQAHRYDEWGYLAGVERVGGLFDDPGGGGSTTVEYTYDSQGQLTGYGLTRGPSSAHATYAYDSAGNPTYRSGLSWSGLRIDPLPGAVYDPATLRRTDPGWSYDGSGRLISDGDYGYRYDEAGRLAQVRDLASGDVLAHYLYDSWGRRVRSWEHDPALPGATRVIYYVRDVEGAVLHEEHWTGHGELVERRTYAYHNGRAVAIAVDDGVSVENRYLFADRIGSTAVRWREAGTMTTQEYSPFGQQMNREASAVQIGPAGYAGHEDDPTGLTYMQARYFDPLSARFNRPDPGRDVDLDRPSSMNLYQYARNTPVNAVDPDGEDVMLIVRGPDPLNPFDFPLYPLDFGHSAVRVFGDGYDYVFNFIPARGGLETDREGPGGLYAVTMGFEGFLDTQRSKGAVDTITWETTTDMDAAVIWYFVGLAEKKLDWIVNPEKTRDILYATEKEYSPLGNNCTTVCLDALEAAQQETGTSLAGWDIIRGRLFFPTDRPGRLMSAISTLALLLRHETDAEYETRFYPKN